jgi:hypothetical protein
MLFKTVALLALASTTFVRAHPKRHDHFHHHHSDSDAMGYPTGGIWNANSTGGWFPDGFRDHASSAAAPSSEAVATLTVMPLPASSTPAASGNGAAVGAVQSGGAVDAAANAATDSCTSTSTTYTTEWVTITVPPPAGGQGQAPTTATTAAPNVAQAAPSISTDGAISLIVTSSVAPGGFFQHSSFSFPGAASSWAVASVPTTFATSQVPSGATASSAAAPSSTGSTGPSTGGKRGLSYNDASLTDAFAGMGISWAYDWGNSAQGTILSGAEFVPMLWGLNFVSPWNAAAKSAIASGSSHLLSFNEPDLSSQSNISPSVAATNHITYMNPFAGNGVQIGSPAVTNGAGTSPPMGIDWLNQFFTACGGQCKVDFVAFHWYNTADSIADFKQHVQDVINAAAAAGVSKVWLTEFQASGTDADVQAFLAEALPFLDSTPAVERYAYFMCATGAGDLLSSSSSLSSIGEAYVA